MRSLLRLHGHRFRSNRCARRWSRRRCTCTAPLDPVVLPATALGSGRYVVAAYEWRLLAGVGHFPHREAPDLVTGEIIRW